MALTGMTYGLQTDASAEHAHQRAMDEAIILAALTGNIWPSDEDFMKRISIQVIDRVTSFAIHARRAVELTKSHDISMGDSRWKVTDGPTLELKFWVAVNKVLHARDMKVATFNNGATMFSSLGDRVITHIEVQSDRDGITYFCPYGMVYAYLSQIVSNSKKKM